MARWWKEDYDVKRHPNKMKGVVDGEYQLNLNFTAKDKLIQQHVIFVDVAQFTFSFLSLRQLEVCLDYFEKRIAGGSRIKGGIGANDHWEVQRWFERLPKGLRSEHRRPKIVKALRQAYEEFSNDPSYRAVNSGKFGLS